MFANYGLEDYLDEIQDLIRKGKHFGIEAYYHDGYNILYLSNQHSRKLGINNKLHATLAGGIRRHDRDENEIDVIIDGLNLGRGMSFKNVAGHINMGGCKVSAAFDDLNADKPLMFLGAVIAWGLLALVVSRGLQGGVEKLCKIMIPALGVIMVVCIIIGLRLPGSFAGLQFLFNPDTSKFHFSSFISVSIIIAGVFAAFSSSISLAEAIANTLMDMYGWSRKKALAITVAGDVIVGSISIVSLALFDKMDVFTCNYLVVIGAFIIAIFAGWVWEIDNFLDAANVEKPLQRTWLKICVKYVCPVAIAIGKKKLMR